MSPWVAAQSEDSLFALPVFSLVTDPVSRPSLNQAESASEYGLRLIYLLQNLKKASKALLALLGAVDDCLQRAR